MKLGRIILVFISPDELVSLPGGSAAYFCSLTPTSTDRIEQVQWFWNDIPIEDPTFDFIDVEASGPTLTIFGIQLQYNGTRIKCSATLMSGNSITSADGVLLVQGLLHKLVT